MYEGPIIGRRRSSEAWRLVVLLAVLLGAVAGLVICTQGMEPASYERRRASRRGATEVDAGSSALGAVTLPLPSPRSATLSLRGVRRRPSRFSKAIWRRVQAMEEDLIRMRRRLHQVPELANQEHRTARIVADALRRLGVKVREGVVGTGVVGLVRGGRGAGAVVALRAAMDGVPVAERSGLEFAAKQRGRFMGRVVPVSHAAGHDVEMAVLLGVAEVLADMRDQLPGGVKFIFQPASEGAESVGRLGVRGLIQAGVLADPSVSALFALKVQPALRVAEVALDTSSEGGGVVPFRIELRTSSRRACRQPGPSCPDLIAAASELVLSLRNLPATRMGASDRLLISVGAIHAGHSGQMLPNRLALQGSIRWRRVVDREAAIYLVRATTRATAALSNIRAKVHMGRSAALIGNNPQLARWALGTAVRVLRRRGIFVSAVPPVTDAGFDELRRRVPSVLIQLGVGTPGRSPTPLRSEHFIVDERALLVGVNLLANLVVDYLTTRPEHRQ